MSYRNRGKSRVGTEIAESAKCLEIFLPLRRVWGKQHVQPQGRVAGTGEGSTEAQIEVWADDAGKEKKKLKNPHTDANKYIHEKMR